MLLEIKKPKTELNTSIIHIHLGIHCKEAKYQNYKKVMLGIGEVFFLNFILKVTIKKGLDKSSPFYQFITINYLDGGTYKNTTFSP